MGADLMGRQTPMREHKSLHGPCREDSNGLPKASVV